MGDGGRINEKWEWPISNGPLSIFPLNVHAPIGASPAPMEDGHASHFCQIAGPTFSPAFQSHFRPQTAPLLPTPPAGPAATFLPRAKRSLHTFYGDLMSGLGAPLAEGRRHQTYTLPHDVGYLWPFKPFSLSGDGRYTPHLFYLVAGSKITWNSVTTRTDQGWERRTTVSFADPIDHHGIMGPYNPQRPNPDLPFGRVRLDQYVYSEQFGEQGDYIGDQVVATIGVNNSEGLVERLGDVEFAIFNPLLAAMDAELIPISETGDLYRSDVTKQLHDSIAAIPLERRQEIDRNVSKELGSEVSPDSLAARFGYWRYFWEEGEMRASQGLEDSYRKLQNSIVKLVSQGRQTAAGVVKKN